MSNNFTIKGNIVDVTNRQIFKGIVIIDNGKIASVMEDNTISEDRFILPGFIDAHIHIESSMLAPSDFARIASVHGTVGVIADPHEIANVLGINGVRFMINNGKKVPFKFYFGAPSCVPATPFESSGAVISSSDIATLLKDDDIYFLAEMMNFPGVVFEDQEVIKKLRLAQDYNKVIDGHAPGLSGSDLDKYIKAGISTDHECFTKAEALEKIKKGMRVLIREGSAAKNFDELIDILKTHPDKVMLCSDDKHPDDLVKGHINLLVKRALDLGHDIFDVLRAVSYNPSKHYGIKAGLLQKGDPADFIMVDDLKNFNVLSTYIDGVLVAEKGKALIDKVEEININNFKCEKISPEDIMVKALSDEIQIIEAIDGQLVTKRRAIKAKVENSFVDTDIPNDILKIVVINRYQKSKPAVAFIKGFGFKKGAIASTIAHDSHNIIAVGTNDNDLSDAVNQLIESRGGISYSNMNDKDVLPLPIAGLMANEDAYELASKYEKIENKCKAFGTTLKAPFMTLSFMALLVIPEIKLSDKGLFDGKAFQFISLFNNTNV